MLTPEQIRNARQLAGLTQGQLAKTLGVSMRTVGNWERGDSSPVTHEARIRAVLGIAGDSARAGNTQLHEASDAELLAEVARRLSRKDEDYGKAAHTPPANLDDVRERRHGQAIGSGQKTPGPELTPPAFEDLAAHPYFKLQAEKNDEYFDGLGEDNQDHGDAHA